MTKKLLTDALKNIGLLAQAKPVWTMHPMLEQMATQFADYVGDVPIAANGKPLLSTALKDALHEYRTAGDDDRLAIGAFTRTLIDCSTEVFAQRVVVSTDRGDFGWSPFVTGLSDFIAAYPGAAVTCERQEQKVPTSIAKAFMMTKILPHSLLDADSLAELLNDAKAVV